MNDPQPLLLQEVERVAYQLAKDNLTWNEPFPAFTTRLPNILESCLLTPFAGTADKEFYPLLLDKASILFYLMIKNHPFQNGNKRMAVTTLFLFLHKNGFWIEIPPSVLYKLAVKVASSESKEKDIILIFIKSIIEVFLSSAKVLNS